MTRFLALSDVWRRREAVASCLRCVTPAKCAIFGCSPGTWPSENPGMAQTTAERQKAFKAAQREAGMVRLEGYVTKEQRVKFFALGGWKWLRDKIDRAKVKP
jgi:hypothetical protein